MVDIKLLINSLPEESDDFQVYKIDTNLIFNRIKAFLILKTIESIFTKI